ncbi:phage tail protein I [Rhizobium tumorigenes]|uniref:phage tail protein I n=1 Tax=Rhizobium tumorigenes TaxID=2041385 RepID=UPI00241DA6E2|nr:phage tail protein I [Rhizobium tumorigenes]WFS02772.1 phage tail protein I [Rhizobium tumorigenes]
MSDYPVILPASSTELEKAVAAIDARRIGSLDTDLIKRIHDPDTCPEAFLPILAWEYSVDEWDPTWSSDVKRAAIKLSYEIHRHKGTAYAIETAITALNYGAKVQEWFEYGSSPYRFRLTITLGDDSEWLRPTADILTRTALRTKNVRSRLESIAVTRRQDAPVYVGGYVRKGRYLAVGQIPKPIHIIVSGIPYIGAILNRNRRLVISQVQT